MSEPSPAAPKKPSPRKPARPLDGDSDLLVAFAAGEPIFLEGQAGEEMYVIGEGEVEIVKQFGPNERHLADLEKGDFFGEISVLEDSPRTATARARTDCRLLPIDAATFDQLLRRHPEITVRMLRQLSRRLRERHEESQRALEVAAGVLGGVRRHKVEPIKPAIRSEAFSTIEQLPPGGAGAGEAPVEELDTDVSDAGPEVRPGRLVHAKSGDAFPLATDQKSVIGRRDPVSGTSPEIDLWTIDEKRSLSRRHARIWSTGGKFFVREEVGVANGTYLRGKRLVAGEDYEIRDGDDLKLGLVELVFCRGT